VSTPGPDERQDWWPTLESVAALVRARTRVRGEREQRELGRFANVGDSQAVNGTRPTADEAEQLVVAAIGELVAGTGGTLPCSPGLRASSATFARYRAAQLVELSYYPEASSSDASAADAYGRLADGLYDRLTVKIPETCAPELPDAGTGAPRLSAAGVVPCRTRSGFRDSHAW
jgi:hypothetical protein